MLKRYMFIGWMALLCGGPLYSQEYAEKGAVLGLSLTGTGYYGDLNYTPQGLFHSDYFSFYPGFNLQLRKARPQRLTPMLNAGYGKFVAQNPELPAVTLLEGDPAVPVLITPNRYAETFFLYADFGYRIQLIRKYRFFRPYLGLGLGGLAYFPRAADGLPLSRMRATRAPEEESYGTLSLSLPLTLGTEFNLSRRLSLHFDYLLRLHSTDYLDNIASLGRQAGNDRLHVLRMGVGFRLSAPAHPAPNLNRERDTRPPPAAPPVSATERNPRIAAFSIPCTLEKKVVQQRIVSYFAGAGYDYRLVKGRLVYENVSLPGIAGGPFQVSFSLAFDDRQARQLLGAFRLLNGDYLSEALYPEESRRAKLFMSRFAE